MTTTTNHQKYFFVNRSDFDNRIDPLYYGSDISMFTKVNHPVKKLQDVVSFMKSGIGAGKQDQSSKEEGILQVRPTNLDEFGILKFDRNIYVPKDENFEIIQYDDLIFNNTNSQELVGKTSILKDNIELTFSNHITILRVKKDIVVPDYLWCILNFYQKHKIFYSICTNWNNQSGIGNELLKSLKIPVPSISIQNQIVDIYNSAYSQKLQKEAEAKSLLESIDTYILDQLSITIPEHKSDIQDRMFFVNFSDINTSRFDPFNYDVKTTQIRESISNSILPKIELKKLIIQSVAGDWGLEPDDIVTEGYEQRLVIRATEFHNEGNLLLENSRVKYRKLKTEKLQKIDVQPFDILIEKSGGSIDQPVGRVSFITEELFNQYPLAYSNFIHKIRVDNTIIDPEYLFFYLKLMHNIKLTESMQSQTNGIRNLIMSNFFNQLIILPSYEMQREIAMTVNYIHSNINQLILDAHSILDQAKKEIESIILS